MINTIYPQAFIKIEPELSLSSFNIPAESVIRRGDYYLVNRLVLFHLNHPQSRYITHSYSRRNITLFTEQSLFGYEGDIFSAVLGRGYIQSGPALINSPMFSSYSPALDHASIEIMAHEKIAYEFNLIRLDDRQVSGGAYKRWLYYRRLQLNLGRIQLGLKDMVLASGIQRGIDFNYINPGAIYQLEQLHGRVEAGSAGQNNDNQLIGFDLDFQWKSDSRSYLDIIVDEFEIDAKDRKRFQDVFGFVIGYEKLHGGAVFLVEYYLASPWLYTNGGMFTNVEIRGISLGHRSPQIHGFSAMYQDVFLDAKVKILLNMYQAGNQSVTTEWNSMYNMIPLYHFDDKWIPEMDASISFNNNCHYIGYLRLTYNLLDSKGGYVMIGFNIYSFSRE